MAHHSNKEMFSQLVSHPLQCLYVPILDFKQIIALFKETFKIFSLNYVTLQLKEQSIEVKQTVQENQVCISK